MEFLENLNYLKSELNGASDHASAIIAASFLDQTLYEILTSYFIENETKKTNLLFSGNGPLSTFSSKIAIAFNLGLISKHEEAMLQTIRKIRNDFAHSVKEISFKTGSIMDMCKNIEVSPEMVMPVTIPFADKAGNFPPAKLQKADSSDARAVFQEAVLCLMQMISARIITSRMSRRKTQMDFVAAHEPFQLQLDALILMIRRDFETREKLNELLIKVGEPPEKIEADKETLMLKRVCEHIIGFTKNAHGHT